ncbi:hypothetical protein GpartN1_g6346.t1 [Galdieria partita]|uniref:Uncharacterized protein n=1 Tax=Galdieria partita TaxID=83374 RepID=A0A9C7Q1Y4_9RHOD|nr:hypothetical protein GpartN1_g6346.t1 [Galdieria partita]
MDIRLESSPSVPRRNLCSSHSDSHGQYTWSKIPIPTFVSFFFLQRQKGVDAHLRTKRNCSWLGTRRVQSASKPFSNILVKRASLLAAVDIETTVTSVNYGQIFLGGISIAVGSLLAAMITGLIANSNYDKLEKEILEDEEQ